MDNCVPRIILVEALEKPSKERQLNMSVVSVTGSSWMDPIITFLFEGILLSEVKEAEKIQRISAWFWLCRDRRLYRQLFGGPYLLCLHPEKVDSL